MREILFRGKMPVENKWAYGSLISEANVFDKRLVLTHIYDKDCNEILVDPKTVGQYTGLKDKNGTKIFEGDVVKYIEIDIDGSDIKGKDGLRWNDSTASFEIFNGLFGVNFCQALFSQIEVIGNIHDNPELLEADKNE